MKALILGSSLIVFSSIAALFNFQSDHASKYNPRNVDRVPAYAWNGAFQHGFALRANMKTGKIPYNEVYQARKQVNVHANKSGSALDFSWEEKGPDNVGGRTRAVIVDKEVTSGNKLYAGSVSGGLFVTENGGADWKQVSSVSTNLTISAIEQAPNGDIYVGTGSNFDGNAQALLFPGSGIYKSTDGVNFELLESTIPQENTVTDNWSSVNRIAIDPKNSNIIYAATNGGLRVSTDGGTTWENPLYQFCDPTPLAEITDVADDVVITEGGRVFVAVNNHGVFYSDNGTETCGFTKVGGSLPTGHDRIALAIAPSNENYVYAVVVTSGILTGIYQSTDKGATFGLLTPSEAMPDLFGGNRQGYYDLCIEAFPNNENSILLGGVELYRLDYGIPVQLAATNETWDNPLYVHADKHFFEFDPHDPSGKTFYIASDGGISKTVDGGNSFFTANRNYNVTQFYGVSFSNDGLVLGGTQDNGTLTIVGSSNSETGFEDIVSTPYEAVELRGGDGFDSEISQFTPTFFASLYYLDIQRAKVGAGRPSFSSTFHCNTENSLTDPDCIDNADPFYFYTSVKLWESDDDPTSKDSIVFIVDTTETGVATGNGVKRTFEGTIVQLQESGEFMPGSVTFMAGTVKLEDPDGDGTISDDLGSGTINYSTGEFSLTFTDAPSDGLPLEVSYLKTYDANEKLVLNSQTDPILVEHTLSSNLGVGETLKVRDPYQSLFALGVPNGVHLTRGATRFEENDVEWMHLTGTTTGRPARMEFSTDGDHLFYGTSLDAWNGNTFSASSGKVVRISGLNDLYTDDDISKTSTTVLHTFNSQLVTGIKPHPTDPETLLVVLGNYGEPNHVYMITNAVSSSGSSETNIVSVQGDLPSMPVYDVEIDKTDPSIVIVATEFGIYATSDIYASNVSWVDESNELGRVPVYEIEQQKLDYTKASNHGVYYIASYGRGIWQSSSLVGLKERPERKNSKYVDLGISPNPISSNLAQLKFKLDESIKASKGNIRIYNITGKLVREVNGLNLVKGANQIDVDIKDIENGSYFIHLVDAQNETIASSKAIVLR